MNNQTRNYLKLAIASLILISLCLSAVISHKVKILNNEVSERQNEAGWFVFQLVKEYSNLTTQIRLTPIKIDDVRLAYDLTWSRFDIILNSKESERFINEKRYNVFFEREFNEFKNLERSITLLEDGSINTALVIKQFMLGYSTIIDFTNTNLRISNPTLTKNQIEISSLIFILDILSVLEATLSFTLFVIILSEIVNERKLNNIDPMTKTYSRLSMINYIKSTKKDSIESYDLVVIKVVNLKEINRRFGLNYGDLILLKIVNQIRGIINENEDFIFRFTEKTFVVIIKNSQSKGKNKDIENFDEKMLISDSEFIPEITLKSACNVEKENIIDVLSSMDVR